ncbi:hypothetical protein [Allosphingosinicella vermicomposti]|uniref:hypothetical protein n=1 Tax=Allosphingosinicella vermicomposti TaxID=614671 RepID=UPI000D101599|nr:hypothetical protein [Allosphingosinicella vermicomposti]
MTRTPAPRRPRSAGAFLALSIIAGSVIGVFAGQPSLGFLIGLGLGVLVAVLVWLMDRRAV